MMKKFKETLLANIEKPMPEQKQLLSEVFEEWKGEYPQVDDMAVLAIRYK